MSLTLFFAVLGAVMGSFACATSERLFTGRSWLGGRSACDSCNKTLTARDLVPVLSWVLAVGHCRHCGVRLSLRYVVVELVGALLFFLAYRMLGVTPALTYFFAALTILLMIVLYDLRHTIVPRNLAALFGILSLLYFGSTLSDITVAGQTLLYAGAFGLGFLLLHVLSGGRAMGLGDTPIVMSLALLAGSQAFAGLLFSFWIGAIVGIAILVITPRGKRFGIEVPFVPFLAVGFLLAVFTGWSPLAGIAIVMSWILGF